MPSIMALMLEALEVASGQRVFEVGTGTGYDAALLCERLGDDKVTSVDRHPLSARRVTEFLSATSTSHRSGGHVSRCGQRCPHRSAGAQSHVPHVQRGTMDTGVSESLWDHGCTVAMFVSEHSEKVVVEQDVVC
jgi:hypothetical protein